MVQDFPLEMATMDFTTKPLMRAVGEEIGQTYIYEQILRDLIVHDGAWDRGFLSEVPWPYTRGVFLSTVQYVQ